MLSNHVNSEQQKNVKKLNIKNTHKFDDKI